MYSTAEERAGWGWETGWLLTLGLEWEGPGFEELTAWVENRTLSAKH